MWQFDTRFAEIVPRSPEVKSFRFPITSSQAPYSPGQFFFVTMSVGDKPALHHFSFSSSPTDAEYIEFTKRITGHDFSLALDAVTPGTPVHIEGPQGEFILPSKGQKIAFLTAGIGITPVRSMLRYVTGKKLDYNVVLLFGNTNVQNILFREEIAEMAASHPGIRVEHVLSGPGIPPDWKGRTGSITKNTIIEVAPDYRERLFYVSGPPKLVMTLVEQLSALKVPQGQIKRDSFTGYD